ncbi:MAG: DUF1987 domain-containing protein [Crocinitomicaceae bacterium]|nr:DUF1987 domain-containing protein [Crocinitomicaceae bacterium]
MKKATENSPNIVGVKSEGTLTITGRSYPEDALSFYTPVAKWLDELIENQPDAIEVVLDLDYKNTATGIVLSELVKKLTRVQNTRTKVIWKYEPGDVDMLEFGEDLQSLYGDVLELVASNAN